MQHPELSYRRFLAYAALAVGVVLVPLLVWQLGSILLLGFAAVLIAVLLHVVSEPLQKFTPLPIWADLLIAGLILFGAVAFPSSGSSARRSPGNSPTSSTAFEPARPRSRTSCASIPLGSSFCPI